MIRADMKGLTDRSSVFYAALRTKEEGKAIYGRKNH